MKYAEILTLIRKIVRAVNLESKRFEKDYGISIPQLLSLSYLQGKEGCRATHKELKAYLQLNPSTVTGITDRLQRKGLVERLPSSEDRRVGLISLTKAGHALLAATPEPLHEQLATRLDGLAPEQLATLQQHLNYLSDLFEVEAPPILTLGAEPGEVS